MKYVLPALLLGGVLFVSAASAQEEKSANCLCIASAAVVKYCERENSGVQKDEYRINQERIARRDIQRLIDHSISADIAKDAAARSFIEAEDLTIKELDGKVYTREAALQIGAAANNYQGFLRISDATRIEIECLTLKGKEAIVYTNQHFVRYVPDRKDESPHEVITNILHRETWIFTESGWKVRYIEELERGDTFLDGKLYNPE